MNSQRRGQLDLPTKGRFEFRRHQRRRAVHQRASSCQAAIIGQSEGAAEKWERQPQKEGGKTRLAEKELAVNGANGMHMRINGEWNEDDSRAV